MFLRPKADGTFRPILNLSGLNEYTVYRHFKMDHLSSVMRTLPQGSYLASIDITSAYFGIPVKMRDKRPTTVPIPWEEIPIYMPTKRVLTWTKGPH